MLNNQQQLLFLHLLGRAYAVLKILCEDIHRNTSSKYVGYLQQWPLTKYCQFSTYIYGFEHLEDGD